jgi:hypothetical protein
MADPQDKLRRGNFEKEEEDEIDDDLALEEAIVAPVDNDRAADVAAQARELGSRGPMTPEQLSRLTAPSAEAALAGERKQMTASGETEDAPPSPPTTAEDDDDTSAGALAMARIARFAAAPAPPPRPEGFGEPSRWVSPAHSRLAARASSASSA